MHAKSVFLTATMFALACSSSSSEPKSSGGDSGPGGTKDGGGGSSGSGSGSGTGGGGTSQTAGLVSFASGGTGLSAGAYTIVGDFDKGSGMIKASGTICTTAVDGCQFCGGSDAGISPGNLMLSFLNAGVLTTKDGSSTLATIDFSDAGGVYEYDSNMHPSLTWNAGDKLSASATGGQFPAFSGSVTAPQDIAALSPALTLTTAASVSLSMPFVLSWTPSSDDGTFSFVLSLESPGGGQIGCTAKESAAMISIPTSVLSQLKASAGTMGVASLTKTVSVPLSVTGVTLSIQAVAPQVVGTISFTE